MIQDHRKLLNTAGIEATGDGRHWRACGSHAKAGYRDQPLLINGDDHFDFDRPESNLMAAMDKYCGWSFFDYRQIREPFEYGYQSLPMDWTINPPRKKGFFGLLAQLTGLGPP